ncbi:Arc-like DNA binding domain-containing protein [Pseudomonas cedrina]|uniref:Arc-like DNA binding domain-containing protein n=1 Tax=Pseudomonas cedrina TaxID=651740 RepID=A0ABY0UZH7_PSECE|nr:Arc family DNA-binding protein [Pseudomonas cedrina]SDT42708.1 Arc-like DNA binding domain-containing protein [Pseudomonas cedrina]
MSATDYNSRTADKFVVRLPDGLRADIEAAANAGDRSMNSVFIQAVRQYLDGQNRQQILLDALANTVTTPISTEIMHIDARVQMVMNSARYEWLRDRGRVSNINSDLCAVSDGTVYFGQDLDQNVDDAIRLARLEELHPCAD